MTKILKKELSEVENDWQAHEEKSKRCIRLLTNVLEEENISFSKMKCSRILEKESCEHFFSIVIKPLSIYLSLFLDHEKEISKNILWLDLINNNKSFRKFSTETFKYCQNLFLLIDLNIYKLTNLLDYSKRFDLGVYTDLHNSEFRDRVKILKGDPLTDVEVSKHIALKNSSFLSFAFVRLKSLQKTRVISFLEESILLEPSPIKKVALYNALSFYYLKNKKISLLNDNFYKIEKTISNIRDLDLKSHLLGNLYLHRAEYASVLKNRDEVIVCLNKAVSFDSNYYDYFYRLAMIYHDEMDDRCIENYQKALMNSPLAFQILNDYVVAIEDFNMKKEKEIVENILKFIEFDMEKYEEFI